MGKIIAFSNQKGGVGKTTSAVNIAASLGLLGERVLLVDLDAQGSATTALGVPKKTLRRTTADVLRGNCTVNGVILHSAFQNLDILPANLSLAGVEFDLARRENPETALKEALLPLKNEYDYLILDCPPSLGMVTVNAMVASDGVVIPLQCEFFALEGLAQLNATISRLKARFHPRLSLTGILVTMYNARLSLSADVMRELQKHYGDALFETKISRNVRLSEAPSFGVPVYYHDKNARGAKEYLAAARELLSRV